MRKPEITKQDQRKEHSIEAALFELDQKTCLLFNQFGIIHYFETLRACLRSPLSFAEYTRLVVGNSLAKYSAPVFCVRFPNKPVCRNLQRLQEAFTTFEKEQSLCSLLTCLIDATLLKDKSSWPVGHIVLIKKNLEPCLFYIGSAKPKLLLLIDFSQSRHASIIVLGASAYPDPLLVGRVPIIMQTIHEADTLNYSEQFIVKHDRGNMVSALWKIRGPARRVHSLLPPQNRSPRILSVALRK